MSNSKNKLVIAAAGSGKTRYLVEEALRDPTRKVLITTFTIANEAEITKRFIERCGFVPSHVTVQTWFSFLIQHGVKPFQSHLFREEVRGLCFSQAQVDRFASESDPRRYYLSSAQKIYHYKLSKAAFRCEEKSAGAVSRRLARIFHSVFVDEVQDMAGYDLDFLKALMGSRSSVVLVGDPRQGVYVTHWERQNQKYSYGKIRDFVRDKCKRLAVHVDDTSLAASYRGIQAICDLSDRLYPDLPRTTSEQNNTTTHDGVFLVPPKHARRYLETFGPIQLRMDVRKPVESGFGVRNFGESKGLSYDRVLIYPTDKMLSWLYKPETVLPPATRAKAYVAMTRARFSVAFVMEPKRGTVPDGMTVWVPPRELHTPGN